MSTNFYFKFGSESIRVTSKFGQIVYMNKNSCVFNTEEDYHIGKRSNSALHCEPCNINWDPYLGETNESHSNKCPGCGVRSKHPVLLFRWARFPFYVMGILMSFADVNVVRDEYGKSYTGRGFIRELKGCPVHRTDMVGQKFS